MPNGPAIATTKKLEQMPSHPGALGTMEVPVAPPRSTHFSKSNYAKRIAQHLMALHASSPPEQQSSGCSPIAFGRIKLQSFCDQFDTGCFEAHKAINSFALAICLFPLICFTRPKATFIASQIFFPLSNIVSDVTICSFYAFYLKRETVNYEHIALSI